jgi:hypothetical protein
MKREKVPPRIYKGLEAVRATGVNMFDFERAASLAEELGYPETAQWIRDSENTDELVTGIINGFEPFSRAE